MKTILWLDDWRNPNKPYMGDCEESWCEVYNNNYFFFDKYTVEWAKSYDEFVEYIKNNPMPDAICFDHDLGYGKNGKDAVNFLVEWCMDHDINLPLYQSQSSNPSGRNNIMSYLDNFKYSQEYK